MFFFSKLSCRFFNCYFIYIFGSLLSSLEVLSDVVAILKEKMLIDFLKTT